MEPRPNLVVVTGGTGHVGAMVIRELLDQGYSVGATAWPAKVDALKNTYPDAKGKLEIVEMTDIVLDAERWPEILKGIRLLELILPHNSRSHKRGRSNPYALRICTFPMLCPVSEGRHSELLDALGQAENTVKRFILTGSIGVFFNPEDHGPPYTYIASKIISEKLMWKTADKYPDIDFTAVHPFTHPPCMDGASQTTRFPRAGFNANKFLYQLIEKDVNFPDYALTSQHVLSLTAPVLEGQKKRFIISQGNLTWVDAIIFFNQDPSKAKFEKRGHDSISRLPNISLTEKVLGMKEYYIPWEATGRRLLVMPAMMDW
ncbi:hypothetical protein K438DRAFT_1971401 [Mycena galopus ATCC 62051]|nr:hypothetical protein K438DRAFT_1971401 [Mycena galopus ATCC 62051]